MSAMAGQTVGPKWLTFFWEPMGTPGRAKQNWKLNTHTLVYTVQCENLHLYQDSNSGV